MAPKKKPAAAEEDSELPLLDEAEAAEVEAAETEEPGEVEPAEEAATKPISKPKKKPKAKAKPADASKPEGKAKSQAKAKAKTKAKAQAKAKAAAKETATVRKKPAGQEPAPKKKPLTLTQQAKGWANLAEDEPEEGQEEEDLEHDPDSEAMEKRNYAKARKFARLLKEGRIPDSVKKLFGEASSKQTHPRLFRTELINRLFKQTKEGQYILAADSPEFTSWVQTKDERFGTAAQKGQPRSVLLWGTYRGNEDAFRQAEADGEIFQQGGLWFYCTVESGRTKRNTDSQNVSGGSSSSGLEDFADMTQFITSRPWADFGESAWGMSASSTARQPALPPGQARQLHTTYASEKHFFVNKLLSKFFDANTSLQACSRGQAAGANCSDQAEGYCICPGGEATHRGKVGSGTVVEGMPGENCGPGCGFKGRWHHSRPQDCHEPAAAKFAEAE